METTDDRLEPLYEALLADFEQHGPAAIEKLRETDVVAYYNLIASLLPQEINLNVADTRGQEEPR